MIKDISVLDMENKEWEALGGRIRREKPYWARARGKSPVSLLKILVLLPSTP
jgi:hypothetical protein